MPTRTPLIRQISWLATLPQLLAVAIAIAIATYFLGQRGVIVGAAVYLAYSIGSRIVIPRHHRRGIAFVKQQQFAGAIPLFRQSLEFFDRHSWIDRFRCVVLMSLLKHDDAGVVDAAAESLGEFAAAASPALPALVELLATEEQEWSAACAIREIGIDRASAEAIGQLKLADGGLWLLIPLLKYPAAALDFVRNNPEAVDVPMRDREELIRLLRHPEPALKPIQEALYQNEQLPLPIIAELGDSRFLPLIQRRLETASAHDKTHLAACARACGAPLGRAVQIDAARPGDFKPKSAWPDVDASRKAADSHGHGDGFMEVILTGQILRADGAPVDKPAFFRMNDAMLLGEQIREEEPITYDPKTGRFVYITFVFAAYSHGDGKREPGPYQTGSSLVQIEAAGCQPLRVQFYDEMPDVRVTLTANGQSPKK